jgi:Trk K+ transport system NAD-binding subunit
VTLKNIFGTDRKEMQVMGIVPVTTVLKEGDILLLFGSPRDLEAFIEV